MEPCTKCEEYMKQGIIFIAVKDEEEFAKMEKGRQEWLRTVKGNPTRPFIPNPYRSGPWCVIKEEAVRRIVSDGPLETILKHRWSFVPMEAWDQLGLPKGEINNG